MRIFPVRTRAALALRARVALWSGSAMLDEDRCASASEGLSGPPARGFSAESAGRLLVEVRRTGATAEVALVGELDLATSSQVQAALDEIDRDPPPRLIIDLRRLSFMDSSGIHLLVTQHNRARERGRPTLGFRRGPSAVQRVLEVVGLDERLPFLDD